MIPYKTTRGKNALNNLKIYEGVPQKYMSVKKVVMPGALAAIRLKPGRKFTRLGDLCQKFGWAHGNLITKLEAKRKVQGAAFFKTKVARTKARATKVAAKAAQLKDINDKLAKLGY